MSFLLSALLACLPARAASPLLDSEIAPVVDLIYDIQFDSAAAAAQKLVDAHPGHPAGPFYRGMVAYQRYILEDAKSSSTLRSFSSDIMAAAAQAQAFISTDAAEGYYYLGAAEGFHARVLVAQRRFFKAVPEGTRSIKHLRRAIELRPGLDDAYLGLGMYHYFRTRIPTMAKPFAFLFFGESGNRELGLAELKRVADRGALAGTEARSILSVIYADDEEAQWEPAAALLSELTAGHPHNPLFRLRAAYVAQRRGLWEQAAALTAPDGEWLKSIEPGLRNGARTAALYRYAESRILGAQGSLAEGALRELEMMSLPAQMVDWVLLRRANIYDLEGNELGADRLYRAVKDPEAAKAAKSFLRMRYPNGSKAVKPLTGIESPS